MCPDRERTTSQRDRSGSNSNNNIIILIINRANNGGFGLANLLMISPVCGRTRLVAFSRMRKAPRAVETRL